MRTLFFLLLSFIPIWANQSNSLFFNQSHFELHLGIDKDGGFIPSFRVPFRWSERLSSSLRFSQAMNTERVGMPGYTGRKTVQATMREIGLTFLSYHLGSDTTGFSLGAGAGYERLERHEFGFFHFPLLAEDVAFENSSDIHLFSPTIEYDLWVKRKRFLLDVYCLVKPVNFLFFKQEILFNPLLQPESNEDRAVNIPMMKVTVAPYFSVHPSLWLGIYGEANYMKISYDRAILDISPLNSFVFSSSSLNFTEIVLMAEARIAFAKFALGGTIPFLGGGAKYIREEIDQITESGTIPYFTFGLQVF